MSSVSSCDSSVLTWKPSMAAWSAQMGSHSVTVVTQPAAFMAKADSPLHHAPHTMEDVVTDDWDRAYSRETAAFPLPYVKESKFWPTVGRVDNVHGDRHLICTCPPVSV